jgi:hypothetical protein
MIIAALSLVACGERRDTEATETSSSPQTQTPAPVDSSSQPNSPPSETAETAAAAAATAPECREEPMKSRDACNASAAANADPQGSKPN